MNNAVTIILAEDDPGHATLIRKNLERAGLVNPMLHFEDGQQTLDFLFRQAASPERTPGSYILLLDIRMPRVDGIEVLRRIKESEEMRNLPVIMLTTTDDPREIEVCYKLGCSNYVTKPVGHVEFIEAIRRLGLFLQIVRLPHLNGSPDGR